MILLAPSGWALLTNIEIQAYRSIAPISIPVTSTGGTGIGMAMLGIRPNDAGTLNVDSIQVQLTSDGGFSTTAVQNIKVYFEAQGGNAVYDHKTPTTDDSLVATSSFTANPVTIPLTGVSMIRPGGGTNYIYVIFDFNATADSSGNLATNVGCEITNIAFSGGASGNTAPTAHGIKRPVDDYVATLAATGIAPVEASQKDERVPVLKMVFDVADGQATVDIDSIRLHRVGSGSDDNDLSAITLFDDSGSTSGTFDANDQAIAGATGTLSGGYILLNPTANLQVTSTSQTYYVAVNVAATANIPGATIGLEIANPSTDVTFLDTIDDDLLTVPTEYAYVLQGYPYTQKGYFDTSAPTYEAPTPTTGNTFLILEYIPFLVTAISPSNLATKVARDAIVTAEFARDIDTGTLDNTSFYLRDHSNNNVTPLLPIAYNSGNKTATLTPASSLLWGEQYTATVTTAVKDTEGNALEATKTWSFTTVVAVYPTVLTTLPENGATEVSRLVAYITATFSKDMDETSITTSTFQLKDHLNNPVSGAVTYDAPSRTARFNPDSDLSWNETYTATITTGVKSSDDLNIQADNVWSFTTKVQVYPNVSNTVPSASATDVIRTIVLQATFDQAINATDVLSSFTLKQGAAPVAGTVTYDSGSKTATFTLSSPPLAYSTQYTATIDKTKIHWTYDGDEVYMQSDKVWSFYTISATPPSVYNVSPADASTSVPIASSVQIVFSKPVTKASVQTAGSFTLTSAAGPVSGSIVPSPDPSAFYSTTYIFTPTSSLSYLTAYTATVTTGVLDTEGTPLSQGKTWSFTTFGFTRATIVNNRLGAGGGSSETLIFVPQSNATDKVSVQVFTTTGKLVRTFYKNVNFSTVPVPIRWDGTNDKGQALGPGLYFVQIVAAGVKQTLKVLIVR